MTTARVFPTRTNMSPTDHDCYFGPPGAFTPKYDEVHISCCFTWDLEKAQRLGKEWEGYGQVRYGGSAITSNPGQFEAGKYVAPGVTITSRGCPNKCPWCMVPKMEGKIKTLKIVPGNIVQDNNLLACPDDHVGKVFDMLRTQRAINFSGGFESRRVTDKIVEDLRGLKIQYIWLAYDTEANKETVRAAAEKLKKYFSRDKVRCYVLVGFRDDTKEEALRRLKYAWDIGTLPFAMGYRASGYDAKKLGWNTFIRSWSRPAAIKAIMNPKKVEMLF